MNASAEHFILVEGDCTRAEVSVILPVIILLWSTLLIHKTATVPGGGGNRSGRALHGRPTRAPPTHDRRELIAI